LSTIRRLAAVGLGVLIVSGCSQTTVGSAPITGPTATIVSSPLDESEQTTTIPTFTTPEPGSAAAAIAATQFRECCGRRPDGKERATLRADQEQVAEGLVRRFGDRIELKVGLFDYPLDPSETSLCPGPMTLFNSTPGLSASLKLRTKTVRSGQDFDGTATITNTSEHTISFEGADPVVATILRHGSSEVVGIFDGEVAGIGMSAVLLPGQSQGLKLMGGTASCDPSIGFALPPGLYDVVTQVLGPETSGPNATVRLSAGPIELRIVE
jgi:hypothetical protein